MPAAPTLNIEAAKLTLLVVATVGFVFVNPVTETVTPLLAILLTMLFCHWVVVQPFKPFSALVAAFAADPAGIVTTYATVALGPASRRPSLNRRRVPQVTVTAMLFVLATPDAS